MPDSDDESDRRRQHGRRSGDFDYCARCGAELPDEEWCPVRTDVDADGDLVVHSFCDDACRDAWTRGDRDSE